MSIWPKFNDKDAKKGDFSRRKYVQRSITNKRAHARCMSRKNGKKENNIETEDPYCYVLVSCEKPAKNGDINVKMSYKGDLILASYLVHGAQNFIEQEMEAGFKTTISAEELTQ